MHRTQRFLCFAFLAACSGSKSADHPAADTALMVSAVPPAGPKDATLRITITNDPKVYADGHAATFRDLDSLLTAIRADTGEVWLYREASDPHLAGQQDSLVDSVLGTITRHDLTVRLSRRPDFSDLHRRSARPDRP
jgi:hypothetical protein